MAAPEPTRRSRLVIRGRVQGVAFRAHTRAEAGRLGVAGWVRNVPDGSVEVLLEGPAPAVEALVAWCRQGPRHARVDGVEERHELPEGLRGFEIR